MVHGDVSTEFLKKLYFEEKLSLPQISKLTNIPVCSIRYKLGKENIKLRSISEGTKLALKRFEVRSKISKTWFKKGFIPWNKDRPWPEEFKKKQSIIRKEFIKNNPELLKKALTFRRPNKTEEKLTSLFQTNFPNEFKFVGDGSFIIEGLNPDWINCNGKKLIVELFGEPWHKKEEVTKRTETFAKYGFKTLVLWWKETRNEKMLIEKVRNFVESNVSGGW